MGKIGAGLRQFRFRLNDEFLDLLGFIGERRNNLRVTHVSHSAANSPSIPATLDDVEQHEPSSDIECRSKVGGCFRATPFPRRKLSSTDAITQHPRSCSPKKVLGCSTGSA